MAKRWIAGGALTALIVACAVVGLVPAERATSRPSFAEPRSEPEVGPRSETDALVFRGDALRRAQVRLPSRPGEVDLAHNPPDPTGLLSHDPIECQFVPRASEGTTTKFRCMLPDGEVVKVKYGHTGEIHAEVAASRLLRALGFGADAMYLVPRVRCYGCPRDPFYAAWALDYIFARETVMNRLPENRYTDFEWVAVERHFEGAEVKAGAVEGWAWYELNQIEPTVGAPRADIDALRVVASLLVHWDNKAINQRLVCRPPVADGDTRCERPFAFIHDLGAAFGPNKVNLHNWETTPVWSDPTRCRLSMRSLPFNGSTFQDVEITEAGRALIARELTQLSEDQILSLFTAARFREFAGGSGRGGDPQAWTSVLLKKVREIDDAGPCPY